MLATVVICLFGCEEKQQTQENEKNQYKQKVIIRDSVYSPLPDEAEGVQYMPSGVGGPQNIPNFDLDDPIIISKMPVEN